MGSAGTGLLTAWNHRSGNGYVVTPSAAEARSFQNRFFPLTSEVIKQYKATKFSIVFRVKSKFVNYVTCESFYLILPSWFIDTRNFSWEPTPYTRQGGCQRRRDSSYR